EGLKEEDAFRSLPENAGETEDDQTEDLSGRAADEDAAAVVVLGDPLGPVDLVEKPVHDEEQDANGDEGDDRLKFLAVFAEGEEDRSGEDEEDGGGGEGGEGADGKRTLVALVGADHARHQGGEDEDSLEAFAEDDGGGVEDDGGGGGAAAAES